MPKAAKNNTPNSPSARPDRQTRRKPSDRAIRAQLVATGLLDADGVAVGVANHPDADLFALAATWHQAWRHFQNIHKGPIARGPKRKFSRKNHAAGISLIEAQEALLAHPPTTPEGVAVLLAAAAETVDEIPPLSHDFTAMALRSFIAIGI